MSQINPRVVLKKGWFIPSQNYNEKEQLQQIGIDVTYKGPELIIRPKAYVNIEINESVNLPKNVYADMKQRSSFSRKGVFMTNGFYDPGFHGTCGLSIYNMSDDDIVIRPNERLAQMIFYKAKPATIYNGTYNRQKDIKSKYATKGE